MTLDDAIDRLQKARKRLAAEQGRIARRNARAAVLTTMRALRSALDAEYPAERKPRKVTVKMDRESIALRRKKKLAKMVNVESTQAIDLMALDVPVQRHALPEGGMRFFVERWVSDAMRHHIPNKTIAAAVRSRSTRRRILSLVRLGAAQPGGQP